MAAVAQASKSRKERTHDRVHQVRIAVKECECPIVIVQRAVKRLPVSSRALFLDRYRQIFGFGLESPQSLIGLARYSKVRPNFAVVIIGSIFPIRDDEELRHQQ